MTFESSRRAATIVVVAALAVICIVHFTSIPLTIWEYDESLFAMAVEKFEPLRHNPPPPGYPLYIGFAKLLQPIFGFVPFRTLIAISIIATIAGFLGFATAFRAITGDWRAGVFGAVLFYLSPAMLMHATLPQSDSGALALLAASICLVARAIERPSMANALFMAVACAITVGWRLQFCIAVVPLFVTALVFMRGWRERQGAVLAFGVACAMWLFPLVQILGGPRAFWIWISDQAAYFAEHDANLSRGGMSGTLVVFRFIAHPWGTKLLAGPLLLAALIGAVDLLRRRARLTVPVVAMSITYLAFAVAMMDPADGVRYALPSVAGVGLLAGAGLAVVHRATGGIASAWVLAGVYAAGAYVYCGDLLCQRARTPSPPIQAIQYIRANVPRNAVILYDVALKPHALYLLRGYRRMKVDEGLRQYGHRMDVPLYELTDSATEAPHGKVFRWQAGDSYSKLTRNHYAAVSVLPVQNTERFLALAGLSPPERMRTSTWRWIADKGLIALPDVGATHVRLTFATPDDYPLGGNAVSVSVEGGEGGRVLVSRGGSASIELAVPRGGARIHMTASETFIPASIPGRFSRDRRRLSVMLVGVQQFTRAEASGKRRAG